MVKSLGYLKCLENFNDLNFTDYTLFFLTANIKMIDASSIILIIFENLLKLKSISLKMN
jgi:hypothetical protein